MNDYSNEIPENTIKTFWDPYNKSLGNNNDSQLNLGLMNREGNSNNETANQINTTKYDVINYWNSGPAGLGDAIGPPSFQATNPNEQSFTCNTCPERYKYTWGNCQHFRDVCVDGGGPGSLRSFRIPIGAKVQTFKGNDDFEQEYKYNNNNRVLSDNIADFCTGNPGNKPYDLNNDVGFPKDKNNNLCTIQQNLNSSGREKSVQAAMDLPIFCQLGDYAINQPVCTNICNNIKDTDQNNAERQEKEFCYHAKKRLCEKQIGDVIGQEYLPIMNEYNHTLSNSNFITNDQCKDFCGNEYSSVSAGNTTLNCQENKKSYCFKRFYSQNVRVVASPTNNIDFNKEYSASFFGNLDKLPQIDGISITNNNLILNLKDNKIYKSSQVPFSIFATSLNVTFSEFTDFDLSKPIHVTQGRVYKGKLFQFNNGTYQEINETETNDYEFSNLYKTTYCRDFCKENPELCQEELKNYCTNKIPQKQPNETNRDYVNRIEDLLSIFPEIPYPTITKQMDGNISKGDIIKINNQSQSNRRLGDVCGCFLGDITDENGDNYYKKYFDVVNQNLQENNGSISENILENNLISKPQCYYPYCNNDITSFRELGQTTEGCITCLQNITNDIQNSDICQVISAQNISCANEGIEFQQNPIQLNPDVDGICNTNRQDEIKNKTNNIINTIIIAVVVSFVIIAGLYFVMNHRITLPSEPISENIKQLQKNAAKKAITFSETLPF